MKPTILVITPVAEIPGVLGTLKKAGKVTLLPDPTLKTVIQKIRHTTALFTNPNKSKVFISRELIDAAPNLKVICTASTGTNHIDLAYARAKNIRVLSLTEERAVINRITSTAEHAFALMMASLRKVPQGWESVGRGEWDYEPYLGRQVNQLVIGIVGYGRLGRLFAGYAKAFGATVLAYDPYQPKMEKGIEKTDLPELLKRSDVISFHVHVTDQTRRMVNKVWFSKMKPNTLLVNTSRGDIMNEPELIRFLKKRPAAFYATDVLSDETKGKTKSLILKEALKGCQILVTPHVGGMTAEGRAIAYNHAAEMLASYLSAKGRTW